MDRLRAAQYLDLSDESWYCYKCGNGFGSARGNYKEGRLIHERDPRGIHPPFTEGEYAFPLVLSHVDEMVTVSEEAILHAIFFMWE